MVTLACWYDAYVNTWCPLHPLAALEIFRMKQLLMPKDNFQSRLYGNVTCVMLPTPLQKDF